MKILALDTTTKSASVAIFDNNLIDEKSISNEITHSEKLLPLVDEILKKHNTNINEIDMFACLNGPGSFTGVRIGLSAIKGFSIVTKKNTFAINSLEAISYSTYLNNSYSDVKYIVSQV